MNEQDNLLLSISEMKGDLKVLVSEFKSMNGSLRQTQCDFKEHEKDSSQYRRKIDILWAIVHAIKWVIIFLFGTGVLYKFIAK